MVPEDSWLSTIGKPDSVSKVVFLCYASCSLPRSPWFSPSFSAASKRTFIFLPSAVNTTKCVFPVCYPRETRQSLKEEKDVVPGNTMKHFDHHPWQAHKLNRNKTWLEVTRTSKKNVRWRHNTARWSQPAADICMISQSKVCAVPEDIHGLSEAYQEAHPSVFVFKLTFSYRLLSTKPRADHGWCLVFQEKDRQMLKTTCYDV